jgi:hemerythrin superfamily protein
MEQVASDVMGAVKATKAKIEGLTGVFQRLTREHGEVAAILLRLKMTSDPRVRAELFPQVRSELLAHERGELAEVYPVFRERTELSAFAESHEREAEFLEQELAAVSDLAYDDLRWSLRFAELTDLVLEHAKEEENTLFPAAQRVLGAPASEQMLIRYEAAKARVKTGPL